MNRNYETVLIYAHKVFGEMLVSDQLANIDTSAAPLCSQVVPELLSIKGICQIVDLHKYVNSEVSKFVVTYWHLAMAIYFILVQGRQFVWCVNDEI